MKRDNNDAREEFLRRVDCIEHNIDLENRKLKKICSAQEYLTTLKESVDRCSELLFKSLEPGREREKINNLIVEGDKNYSKAFDSFQEYSNVVRKRVVNLNEERENVILEYERGIRNKEHDDMFI